MLLRIIFCLILQLTETFNMSTCKTYLQHCWLKDICKDRFNKRQNHVFFPATDAEFDCKRNQNIINKNRTRNTNIATAANPRQIETKVNFDLFRNSRELRRYSSSPALDGDICTSDDRRDDKDLELMMENCSKYHRESSLPVTKRIAKKKCKQSDGFGYNVDSTSGKNLQEANNCDSDIVNAEDMIPARNTRLVKSNDSILTGKKASGIPRVSKKPLQCFETVTKSTVTTLKFFDDEKAFEGNEIIDKTSGIPRVSNKPMQSSEAITKSENIAMIPMQLVDNENATVNKPSANSIQRVSKKQSECEAVAKNVKKPLQFAKNNNSRFAGKDGFVDKNVASGIPKKASQERKTVANNVTKPLKLADGNNARGLDSSTNIGKIPSSGIPKVSKKPIQDHEAITNHVKKPLQLLGSGNSNAASGIPKTSKKPLHDNETNTKHAAKPLQLLDSNNSNAASGIPKTSKKALHESETITKRVTKPLQLLNGENSSVFGNGVVVHGAGDVVELSSFGVSKIPKTQNQKMECQLADRSQPKPHKSKLTDERNHESRSGKGQTADQNIQSIDAKQSRNEDDLECGKPVATGLPRPLENRNKRSLIKGANVHQQVMAENNVDQNAKGNTLKCGAALTSLQEQTVLENRNKSSPKKGANTQRSGTVQICKNQNKDWKCEENSESKTNSALRKPAIFSSLDNRNKSSLIGGVDRQGINASEEKAMDGVSNLGRSLDDNKSLKSGNRIKVSLIKSTDKQSGLDNRNTTSLIKGINTQSETLRNLQRLQAIHASERKDNEDSLTPGGSMDHKVGAVSQTPHASENQSTTSPIKVGSKQKIERVENASPIKEICKDGNKQSDQSKSKLSFQMNEDSSKNRYENSFGKKVISAGTNETVNESVNKNDNDLDIIVLGKKSEKKHRKLSSFCDSNLKIQNSEPNVSKLRFPGSLNFSEKRTSGKETHPKSQENISLSKQEYDVVGDWSVTTRSLGRNASQFRYHSDFQEQRASEKETNPKSQENVSQTKPECDFKDDHDSVTGSLDRVMMKRNVEHRRKKSLGTLDMKTLVESPIQHNKDFDQTSVLIEESKTGFDESFIGTKQSNTGINQSKVEITESQSDHKKSNAPITKSDIEIHPLSSIISESCSRIEESKNEISESQNRIKESDNLIKDTGIQQSLTTINQSIIKVPMRKSLNESNKPIIDREIIHPNEPISDARTTSFMDKSNNQFVKSENETAQSKSLINESTVINVSTAINKSEMKVQEPKNEVMLGSLVINESLNGITQSNICLSSFGGKPIHSGLKVTSPICEAIDSSSKVSQSEIETRESNDRIKNIGLIIDESHVESIQPIIGFSSFGGKLIHSSSEVITKMTSSQCEAIGNSPRIDQSEIAIHEYGNNEVESLANDSLAKTKQLNNGFSSFGGKPNHSELVITKMTSAPREAIGDLSSDFITINQKNDANNNSMEPINRIKLGSFSTRNDSKFGLPCQDLSLNDVKNREVDPIGFTKGNDDVLAITTNRPRMSDPRLVFVQTDKETESRFNLTENADQISETFSKRTVLNKSKDRKTAEKKAKKDKTKKLKKSGGKDEVNWGKSEIFYSSDMNPDVMPNDICHDVLRVQDTNVITENLSTENGCTNAELGHYKLAPNGLNMNVELGGVNASNSRETIKSGMDNNSFAVLGLGTSGGSANINNPNATKTSAKVAKIKPYTVFDLATKSALTPAEVQNCLEEKTISETIEWLKYGGGNCSGANLGHFENLGQNGDFDDGPDEAPSDMLPPKKNFRKRSNTTGLILNKVSTYQTYDNSINSKTSPSSNFSNDPEDNIITLNYSQPGQNLGKKELTSFRHRSRTEPVKSELQSMARNVARRTSETPNSNHAEEFACQLSHLKENNQGPMKDSCGSSITNDVCSGGVDEDTTNFPPLPTQDQLKAEENQVERCSTPDWPPVPSSLSEVTLAAKETSRVEEAQPVKDEVLKKVQEKQTNDLQVPGKGSVSQKSSESDNPEVYDDVKIPRTEKAEATSAHDNHRSLPPIPGNANCLEQVAEAYVPAVPLSWVTKSMSLGPGPFIPMRHHERQESDEIPTAHFYDDIDNIRKIAQERALMIKRLQEEEAASRLMGNFDVNKTRTSLGEMPDVIPNIPEPEPVNIEVENTGRRAEKKKKKKKKASKETQDLENDNISELSVATKEKRNRSRFAKLIRKISAPSKTSTDNHVQRKATTPEPVRKSPLTRTDRSEIYATPSATRRLFSLSNNRRQRERTTSDTEIMKSIVDSDDPIEPKREKQRTGTISFGFGRKKQRAHYLEQKAFSDDNRSIHSLELMRLGQDFDSQSSCSSRITPVTSPFHLKKFNSSKKYRAPDPPNWKKDVTESCSSVRSEGSEKSFDNVLDRVPSNSSSENTNDDILPGQSGPNITKPAKPSCTSIDSAERLTRAIGPYAEISNPDSKNTDIQDDVFAAGCYQNYPLSKEIREKPAKPPRSESEVSEFGPNKSFDSRSMTESNLAKIRPKKPRRTSVDNAGVVKPEPYSSQRVHRKIVVTKHDLDARFSPTLSISDDDSSKGENQIPYDSARSKESVDLVNSSQSDYFLSRSVDNRNNNAPYENIRNYEAYSASGVKSSTSDYCLSSKIDRNENFSKSEEVLDRIGHQSWETGATRSYHTSGTSVNHREHIYDRVHKGSPNILRHSIDSYDKLLEIHRETIQQIATATCFKCTCSHLQNTTWKDFKVCGKMMNYGIGSYVTVPVSLSRVERQEEVAYSAWLRQSLDFLQKAEDSDPVNTPLCELTYHENLLHICKEMQQNRADDVTSENQVPQDIHVNSMLLSKCTPNTTLARYLSSTLDKHENNPTAYEKEACLILLQIFKGLRHLSKGGYYIEDIDCDLVLLSDVTQGVSSSGNSNASDKKVVSCPTALCLALPGLLKRSKVESWLKGRVVSQSNIAGANDSGAKLKDLDVEGHCSEVEGQSSEVESQSSVDVKGQTLKLESQIGVKGDVGTEAKGYASPNKVQDVKNDSSIAKGDDSKDKETNKDHDAISSNDDRTENDADHFIKDGSKSEGLASDCKQQIIALIFELFHSCQRIQKDMNLPVKSIYSKRLQFILHKLSSTDAITIESLVKYLELISFCPPLTERVGNDQTSVLIRKWRNRRCVDLVTDMLKKYSLIALASGLASAGEDKLGLSRDCLLECEFLANTSISDVKDVFEFL